MTIEQIDYYFPFFVWLYGIIVTFVLSVPKLMELAELKLPVKIYSQLKGHKVLAFICLWIGSAWALQNIWYGQA